MRGRGNSERGSVDAGDRDDHDAADDDRVQEQAEPPLMHDGMPITGYYRDEPIPDLNAPPQDPTGLALVLTVRGVDRALYDERRER